ncbi:MAG: protein-disulfide reductase DsbD family protein [Brachymonas sp.]|nr:protein-disulfide reductase DsbD family protein [Brachymonas sp.]
MNTAYRLIKRLWMLLLCLSLAGTAFAQAPASNPISAPQQEARTDEVAARLLAWAPQGIAPGQTLWLGVQLQHAPDWHTYWINPGQAGMATNFEWKLPEGWIAGNIAWPTPVKFPVGDLVNLGYDGHVLLAVPVQIPSVPQGDTVTVGVQANWLACRTECLPQQGELGLQLPLGQPIVSDAALFTATQKLVPAALTDGSVQASVQADRPGIAIEVKGLPAAWQGQTLNVYPEAEGAFNLQAGAQQRWQGQTLHLDLPLDMQRTQNPADLALVVALQDAGTANQAVQRNAHEQSSYRLQTQVQGQWPAAANPIENTVAESASGAALAQGGQVDSALAAAGADSANASSSWLGWWLSMGAALLGGLLLNLMPCVFPVLGIKVLGFSQHAHSARELRLTGILYAVGCIASFLVLAGALLILRAGGEQLGWGFQLQNPYVVAALAILFTVLALNFLGLFEVGQWLPAAWQDSGSNRSLGIQAFSSGVLSVLVASPCSAPFVGAALGFALNLPAWQALAVFACLGLGLSLPVLLASFVPALLRWLPKPGQWMIVLRQWMAFPMFVTVVWLAWVLGQQRGVGSMAVLLGLLVLLAGLLWAWQLQGTARRVSVAIFALALLGVGNLHRQQLAVAAPVETAAAAETGWQPWSPERAQAALQAGQPVLVNYHAAWCITCQFNKKNVFEQASFAQLARQHNVALLSADWTRSDPAITKSLRSLGRAAVPTYAIYHPGQADKPQILTELLTLEQIEQALKKF